MIEIHTLAWRYDKSARDADTEPANASIFCRVFIDGREIPGVMRAVTTHFEGFAVTRLLLSGAVEVVNHTQESWDALPVEGLDAEMQAYFSRRGSLSEEGA